MTEAITQDSDAHEATEGQRSQRKRKKKRRPIKRIFKCFGLGLLVLLIIAGLIFQAPWKVITLLLVILAACTVLPKCARKWFWLSVAGMIIALEIWVFLPDGDADWRSYTFDEELAALEAKYAVSDEENAAAIYDKLFEDIDGDPNEPEFFLQSSPSSKDGPWLSKDHPETAEWLKGHQDKISILLQATKKDKCHFPMHADPWSFGQYMERLAKIRRCAFLLLSAGNNDIGEGRIDAGLEKHSCIIRMADHLYQQPVIIDFLTGFAIEGLALTQLNRFVMESHPNAEQLELIGDSIKGLEDNWGSDFIKILEHEKLFRQNTFCSLAYQVNPRGKVRLGREPTAPSRATEAQKSPTLSYPQRKLLKAHTILNWFFMSSTPQKVAAMFEASSERYYAMAEPDFDWDKGPDQFRPRLRANYDYVVDVLTNLLAPAYYSVHDTYLRNLSLRRGSRLLVAIRQYKNENGTWPENLEQVKGSVPAEVLVDPITGDAFVYKLIEEDFMLYSRGKNGIDEGGIRREVVDPNAAREPVDANFFKEIQELESEFFGDTFDPNVLKQMFDPNDYRPTKTVGDDVLISPPKSHKTEKENIDAEQQ
jgi:hypothetical protein